MVITRVYSPSDIEAMMILNRIKAKLGISGKIDTPGERERARQYLESRGLNMSMIGCNPDVFFLTGNRAEDKALCMLYNEMSEYQIQGAMKRNEEQLKKYGNAFLSTYKKNESELKKEYDALSELQKNTGIKTVPQGSKLTPQQVKWIREAHHLHPAPNPTIPHTTNPKTVHVTTASPSPVKTKPAGGTKTQIDVKKVGLGLLGLAVLYYVIRRV